MDTKREWIISYIVQLAPRFVGGAAKTIIKTRRESFSFLFFGCNH